MKKLEPLCTGCGKQYGGFQKFKYKITIWSGHSTSGYRAKRIESRPWPVWLSWLEHHPIIKRLWVWSLVQMHTISHRDTYRGKLLCCINVSLSPFLSKGKKKNSSQLSKWINKWHPFLQKKWKAGSQKDICTPMFTAAIFTVAKTWKKPKCPLANEWVRQEWQPTSHRKQREDRELKEKDCQLRL